MGLDEFVAEDGAHVDVVEDPERSAVLPLGRGMGLADDEPGGPGQLVVVRLAPVSQSSWSASTRRTGRWSIWWRLLPVGMWWERTHVRLSPSPGHI